jgi:hypothetical protein
MGDFCMIQSIGYESTGGVWMSLFLEVDRKDIPKKGNKKIQMTAIVPMSQEKAEEIKTKLGDAMRFGQQWKETGVDPNVGNSPNTDKIQLESNKRDSHG